MSEQAWDTVVVFELTEGGRYATPAMDAKMAAIFLEEMRKDPPAWGRPIGTETIGTRAAAVTGELLAFDPNQPRRPDGKWGSGGTAKGGTTGALPIANDMSDFNEIGQAAILERAGWLADNTGEPGFPRSVDEMAEVLDGVYAKATPEQIAAGKVWYQENHDQLQTVAKATNTDFDTAVAITARMSPGREWESNLELAGRTMRVVSEDKPFTMSQEKFDKMHEKPAKGVGPYKPSELTPEQLAFGHPDLSGKGTGGSRYETTGQVADGVRLMRGDVQVTDVLVGTKISNFYNNLRDPKDPTSVTIDIHQAHAMVPRGTPMPTSKKPGARTIPSHSSELELTYYTGSPTSVKGGVTGKIGMYPMFGSAVQQVAAKRGLLPNQVQAITWLVQREMSA